MSNDEILKLLKKSIPEIAPEACVYLFGSRARGDYRPDSDVDLLILLPDSYEGMDFVKRNEEISSALYYLSLEYEIDISPIITVNKIYYKRETPFTLNVKKEGIKI